MVTQKQIDIIISTMKPFNPTKIGIFGSMARGEADGDSDIDILYSFSSRYSLFDLGGLYEELKSKLNREVDLLEFSAIHPKLRDSILSEAKIVYNG
tara:strand:+ start:201 stop:488 length:288 start_codon:yes stop_codon:yes gene_type:complete